MSKDPDYDKTLRHLQIELVKLQRHVISEGMKVLIILEGRDGAGKDGTVKRITEHLSPRDIRIVALPKPSDVQVTQWYFQRYVEHLPAAGEIVLFNRSWYNRAGVEPVMGFCTDAQYHEFLRNAPVFEAMLDQAGIKVLKYYLDISRKEQKKRLDDRHKDPLKQWKISPIDEKALKHFDDYTEARDRMLRQTDSAAAPWMIVRANDKKAARLAIIADLIRRIDYKNSTPHDVDEQIVCRFDESCLTNGMLAR
ncbi:polyphosphate kinase 2 [Acidocella aromatica]|uniref:ADP/GDP-polyphosphate phosphotransferase n=1 Tax=Acidocella aromatica TaxID=1303579 RepID=A0A840VJS8_9PROT|nr:polyphosphate kinase 2 [Acidocella aromatica]MBB5372509.1 polyphosphate kinase 2 [Acidocella aromatica]